MSIQCVSLYNKLKGGGHGLHAPFGRARKQGDGGKEKPGQGGVGMRGTEGEGAKRERKKRRLGSGRRCWRTGGE